jgi:hypothetical protein
LSKINQAPKAKHHIFAHIWNLGLKRFKKIIKMGLKCKRGTVGVINGRGRGKGEVIRDNEDKCMEIAQWHPPNIVFKRGKKAGSVREYNRGGILAHNTLHQSMEFSHEIPLDY